MAGDGWQASTLEIAAGVVALGSLAVTPVAALTGLVLAAAVTFAGSRRFALALFVTIALGGVAGLTVANSERSPVPDRRAMR